MVNNYFDGFSGVALALMPYGPSIAFDPSEDGASDIAGKRNHYTKVFGFGIATIVGQGLILSGTRISPYFAIGGTLASIALADHAGKYRATMYKIIHAANLILGAISLYSGYYAFGAVAVVLSSLVLLNKNVNKNGLGEGDYFLKHLNSV